MNTIQEENSCVTGEYKDIVLSRLESFIRENGFVKNNIINLFQSLDINKELQDYINNNNISLKELSDVVSDVKNYMLSLSLVLQKYQWKQKPQKINEMDTSINIILKNNLSFIENFIENKRKKFYDTITDIIKRNNIMELREFMQKNDISLSDLSTESYDLLVYAIENNISDDIIRLILSHYPTLNYYFFDNEEGTEVEKSPLSSAIAEDNFKLADLLIQNKADINYKLFFNDIIKNLTINKLLDDKNLKYILNKGFHIKYVNLESSLIYELIKASYPSYFIEIFFKHFIFDNDFILNFLHYYKNKERLSHRQLSHIIKKEKSKISIKDRWYNTAIEFGALDAIDIFIEYDIRKEDAILNLIKKKIE
jgi:hypothetical protein